MSEIRFTMPISDENIVLYLINGIQDILELVYIKLNVLPNYINQGVKIQVMCHRAPFEDILLTTSTFYIA